MYLTVVGLLVRSLEGVCVYLCPLPKRPESNDLPLLAVAVWAVESLFIHLTFVPRLMVMCAGLKRKFWIEIVLVGCFCALAVGCLYAPEADTTKSVLTTTSVATVINKMMRLIRLTSSSYWCCSRPHDGAFVHNGSGQQHLGSNHHRNLLSCSFTDPHDFIRLSQPIGFGKSQPIAEHRSYAAFPELLFHELRRCGSELHTSWGPNRKVRIFESSRGFDTPLSMPLKNSWFLCRSRPRHP